MADEQKVIGYGTSFATSFLGMSTTLRVVSPINDPAPDVDVEINYTASGAQRTLSLEGDFFENLLSVLASVRQHTNLLAGAEFGFLASFTADHQAVLFSEVGPARVIVSRSKGLMGTKDKALVVIDQLSIEKELNDRFFQEIGQLQSAILQTKQKVAEKIRAYNAK